MADEPLKSLKPQLAIALAQGKSVAAWARGAGVPIRTAYRWSKDPKVRKAVEAHRRHWIDRAVGMLSGKATWSVGRITKLADNAESESVRLGALRGMLTDMIAVSKYFALEDRMASIEERLDERAGNTGRQG
jgi:hypothetical protein